MTKLAPMHPGEVLREEFLKPLEMSPYKAAEMAGVPRTRLERLANEETGVTADTALRLGKLFGTTAQFWMNLQARYDLLTTERQIAKELRKIEQIETKAA